MHFAYMLHQTSHLTFGRDTAQFKQLLAFMAIVSIAVWSMVLATIVARMWFCHVWYRYRYQHIHSNSNSRPT